MSCINKTILIPAPRIPLSSIVNVRAYAEVGRTTLSGTSTSIAVTGLPNKQFYIVLAYVKKTAALVTWLRINNDSGSNYAYRSSSNGAADATTSSDTKAVIDSSSAVPTMHVMFINNITSHEKLVTGHHTRQNQVGATNVPTRLEYVAKWANTSSSISRIDLVADTSTFASGSEVVVLGADLGDLSVPAFFKELGRNTLGGTSSNIQTTITSKRYLLIQAYLLATAQLQPYLRMNNTSTGTPYADRNSLNGAADATNASQNQITIADNVATPQFVTLHAVTIATQEKLVLGWSIDQNTAGAGNAPGRRESIGKWTDATNAVTEVDFVPSTSTFASGSEVIVYGSD